MPTVATEAGTAPAEGTGPIAVQLQGITKRFPGVVANRDVNITVRRGSVHAIVGENGAGKSTLMKILYGMQRPDEGTISVDGQQLTLSTPADAIAAGIGMVHQHFMLADNFTVLENVVLGSEPRKAGGRIDFDTARDRIQAISESYGLDVRPDALVADLGVGDRQRVEILKVLYRGARILILDEPTAVLVPQEVHRLFGAIHELTDEGFTVIFISHHLDEVLEIADEITVIRRGETVATVLPADVTASQLAELMVGSELPSPETRESTVTDRVVLSGQGLTVADADGRELVSDVDLTIHAGEILGIAGVEGNGQTQLVEAVIGMVPLARGHLELAGTDITGWGTRRCREEGIGFIPEDRARHGLLLEAPLWENRMLGHQTQRPNARGIWVDRKGARADTERIIAEYDVRTPGIDVTANSLSGGNQQKFIVGREMSGTSKLLVAAHPTRGVDVGAQAAIWEHIRRARREGLAVLLVSADLDELIGLSDTIKVMLRGRLVADADPATVTPEQLGSAMTGAARAGNGGPSAPLPDPVAQDLAAPDTDAPVSPSTDVPSRPGSAQSGEPL
jgi:general nucleoside transport system ATP-binding protein